MPHVIVPEAEAILDHEIRVLDKGFVRLVDYMGGDDRIVQSARVSYGEGTRTARDDAKLIHYLVAHRHTSPLEQVVLTFHCKMPIFVARQWVRHRMARLNEISGRYSIMRDEFYVPHTDDIRRQSRTNKQGRDTDCDVPEPLKRRVLEIITRDQHDLYEHYRELIDDDVARELARINLPLSLYTEWYWQIDLHNLFHFLRLRADGHAQYEIQQYARVLADCARRVAPVAYEAFEEYILHSATFSRGELEALRAMLEGAPCPLEPGRRRREFFARLGTPDPAAQPAPEKVT